MRFALFSALIAALAAPAFADETTGEILAFDRKAGIIVLKDKTVWALDLAKVEPDELVAGDMVVVMFDAEGEDGITEITSIEKK